MKNVLMGIVAGLIFAISIPAVEKTANLAGTWVFDPAHSDSGGQARRTSRAGGGFPGSGGGFPGIGIPGIGFPGGGRRGGGGYPGGRGGDDGGESRGEGRREQMQNLTLQIVQTENEVQAKRKFTVDGEDRTVEQKFLLDGSENKNPASNDRGEFVSRSTWKNSRLTNTGWQDMSRQGESYNMPIKEEYSVSKDGKVLIIKTTRTTPRGEATIKQVFNRQETEAESSPSQQ